MQRTGQLLFSLASQLALILFAGATTALTVTHTLSVPEAIALIVVIARYLEPFTSISELGPALESTRSTLDRIRSVLSAPVMAAGPETRRGHYEAPLIEFEDVAFCYGGASTPVLDGVSFALRPGTTTAIVGPSRPLARADPGADCPSLPPSAAASWLTASTSQRWTPKPVAPPAAWFFSIPICSTERSARTSPPATLPPARLNSPGQSRWRVDSSPEGCPPGQRPSSAKPDRRCPVENGSG